MRSAKGYSNEDGEWRLVCAPHSPGLPREIKDVKWFRNGKEISYQSGFKLTQMDLLIEVGILCLTGFCCYFCKEITLISSPHISKWTIVANRLHLI